MEIDILTLFPAMFKGPFDESILRRAQDKSSEGAKSSDGDQNKGLVEIKIHNLRKWAIDKRGTVDDRPYGGGVGMILMIQPIFEALLSINPKLQITNYKSISNTKFQKSKTVLFQDSENPERSRRNEAIQETRRRRAQGGSKYHGREPVCILLSPRGKVWNQKMAKEYSKLEHLILICGHYEGVDERVREFIDEEISIGDFVLTGGEIPAMVLVDSIVRLIPGVLEKPEATQFESFSPLTSHLSPPSLEYPQYTRPENFRGLKVPEILLSGDHKKISEWRQKKALEITKKNRPDLLK